MVNRVRETPYPRATIENCEDEPIHIPGAIQDRGLLFGLDTNGRITHAAGKIPGLKRFDEPLGRSIHEVAPEIAEALAQENRVPIRRVSIDHHCFALLSHINDQGVRIIELEPDEPGSELDTEKLRKIMDAGTVLESLEHATSLIRELTGYDRVLAYMFDSDHNGTVLAEDQRAGLDSYLHQRFPASDIPPQAMRLYKRKRVRHIADVGFEPQPIWGIEGSVSSLDLSEADLRAVSPIHIEYLQNMGVKGSLVCTLIAEGQVLGMLACHHMAPKYITPSLRGQVDTIAIMTAHRVLSVCAIEANQRRIHSYKEIAKMLLDVTDEDTSPQGLGSHIERVQTLIDAEGAAIILEGRVYTSGKAPSPEDVLRISNALAAASKNTIQSTDQIQIIAPELSHLGELAAGVIRCPLLGDRDDAVLWFRPEVIRSETWAGDPSYKASVNDNNQHILTPRASFEAYIKQIRGKSHAWQPWELDAVEAVRGLVSNIAARMRSLRDLAAERQRLNEELAEARDSALAASQAKTDFLANMSHEIRTPMTAILGYSELLAHDFRSDPLKAAEAVEVIQSNATHMLELINDILDVSKIEAGHLKVETIRMSPIRVVEEVAALVASRAAEKGIDLRIEYTTPVPDLIHSDPTRIRQVLLNLVGNALKFTDEGTVAIAVSCHPSESQLVISVNDTGIGLSPSQLERISRFEAFTQADESTTRLYGGTGLGLRISSALAGMLGGHLEAESELGTGSRFTLTISTGPIDGVQLLSPSEAANQRELKDHHSAPDEQSTNREFPLSGIRILFAEDGPDNQRLIAFHLNKAGASVEIADNGALAVKRIEAARDSDAMFDLVLMDMQMPELDGYGATRRIRDMGLTVPIIALTAHAMEGDRRRCLDAGCNEYLTKPIDRAQLIATCCAYASGANRLNRPA